MNKPPMTLLKASSSSENIEGSARLINTSEAALPVVETGPVDSALLHAISNPRERMVLFQIEDSIRSFVKSR